MAITIIHRGRVPVIKYVGTCGYCNTKVECDKQDRLYKEDSRFGYYYLECPVCKSRDILVKEVESA